MRNPEGHSPRWWKRHPQAKAKAEAAILPASQSVATPEPKKFRWDITLTLLVAVMGMLFYLFPPQSALSTSLWLFVLFGLSIYPALHFADIAFSGKKKVAYPIMLALLVGIVVALGIRAWPPKSQLLASAEGSAMTYGGGIEWRQEYSALRLTIKNPKSSLQNLDLTIQADKSLIFQMGQLGAVPNVEFHAVGFPADFGERLKTKAGGNIFITLKDAIAMSGSHPPNLTGQWKVFCPRLVGATELELVLAVPQPGSPKTIKITGKYESLPSDSGKTISVNMDVPVRY